MTGSIKEIISEFNSGDSDIVDYTIACEPGRIVLSYYNIKEDKHCTIEEPIDKGNDGRFNNG